jgi:Ca2+/Na+ antiporter
MRYNINKKKIKFNLTSLVILFYMFLNFFMNNLYKYRHYVLVIILIIWLIWYVKYDSKIKEGWFWKKRKKKKSREQIEREKREQRKREEERARRLLQYRLDIEALYYNKDIADACINKAFTMHKNHSDAIQEIYKCYYSYDVIRKGTTIKSK